MPARPVRVGRLPAPALSSTLLDLGGVGARFLVLTGTVLVIGVVVFLRWVLPGARRRLAHDPGDSPASRPEPGSHSGPEALSDSVVTAPAGALGLGAACALLSGVLLLFVVQAFLFRDPYAPMVPQLRLLLTRTPWGWAWLFHLGAALAGLVVTIRLARSRRAPRAWIAVTVAALLALAPALTGHSVGVEEWLILAVGADALHVLAAGAWLGTLGAVAVVSGRVLLDARTAEAGLEEAEPDRGQQSIRTIAALVKAFSPLALTAGATVAATGLFASWLHLGGLSDLWTTEYGRTLSVKVVLVAVVAALGAYNWKRATPRLEAGRDASSFVRVSARLELAVGVLVLIATAVLVGTTLPMDM